MHIIKVGVNYRATPIEVREKLTFSEDKVEEAMIHLNNQKSVLENVIFSTCNRTEVYAVVEQIDTGRKAIKQFLRQWFQIDNDDYTTYFEVEENDAVIEHLLRVTTGLNSMVLGETQILGQVRDAFLTAQQIKTTGSIFNELFKRAVTFAKHTHRSTAIGERAVSVSYAAVELAKNRFGGLENKQVVIIGAGEMAELALRNMHSSGAKQITVVNRTLARAEKLADIFQVKAAPTEELGSVLQEADIVISSTASTSPILSREQLDPIYAKRKDKPLFLVDIAVPRDIDTNVSELDNTHLYDIDDLQAVIDGNFESRQEAATEIELLIKDEMADFKHWMTILGVVPVISALRENSITIQEKTLASIFRKIPDLTEREKEVLYKHTISIVNQLTSEPIKMLKELASKEQSTDAINMFIDVFGLDHELKEQVAKRVRQYENMALDVAKSRENAKSLKKYGQII